MGEILSGGEEGAQQQTIRCNYRRMDKKYPSRLGEGVIDCQEDTNVCGLILRPRKN